MGSGLFINATEPFFHQDGLVAGGPVDEGPVDEGPVDTGPTDEGPGDVEPVNSLEDLRFVDIGEIPADGVEVFVDVEEGEGSFLFYTQAADIDAQIVIADVIGPDAVSILTDLLPDGRQGEGDAAVLVPLTDATVLLAGTYTVTVFAEAATTAGVIFKRATAGGAQVLNVKLWVATSSDEVADAAGRANLGGIFRDAGNEIFGPANLSIGTLEFIDAPQAISDQFGTLSVDDSSLRELCGAMSQEFGQDRSLHVVLVDGVGAGDILGVAAGIPGATVIGDSRTSCVVVAPSGDDLADQAQTAWHEAGHLLGLNHTSESAGDESDFLPDTPECDLSNDADGDGEVSSTECPDGLNFMFWSGVALEMSEDQGNMLARHPLFQPAG